MAVEITNPGYPQPNPNIPMRGECLDCGTKVKCLYKDITHTCDEDDLIKCPHCRSQWIQLFTEEEWNRMSTPEPWWVILIQIVAWIFFFVVLPSTCCWWFGAF